MGEQGRSLVQQQFNKSFMVRQVEDIYDNLIAANQSSEISGSTSPNTLKASIIVLSWNKKELLKDYRLDQLKKLGYDVTLFQERTLCSVTANTREDGEEFLALAERFAWAAGPLFRTRRLSHDVAHHRARSIETARAPSDAIGPSPQATRSTNQTKGHETMTEHVTFIIADGKAQAHALVDGAIEPATIGRWITATEQQVSRSAGFDAGQWAASLVATSRKW
jgi:hypothetical protein